MGTDAATAAALQPRACGAEVLLDGDALGERSAGLPTALDRLECVLGGELTRLLLVALAGDHGMRSRGLPG